jgi:ribonucleoside-triphosphate reductase
MHITQLNLPNVIAPIPLAAAFLQRWWSDNQVSATVTFDPETEAKDLKHALSYFQYQLKGVSLLPRLTREDAQRYPQMPYEAITEAEYNERLARTSKLMLPLAPPPGTDPVATEVASKFCDAESCSI